MKLKTEILAIDPKSKFLVVGFLVADISTRIFY